MEIKAKLNKPFTEEERLNFIVINNHNLGFKIKETKVALEAWGYTTKEKEQQEEERISHLKCTKRVFVLMLEQLGFDYFEQIEPLINANRQAKLEWELCVELERSNPLLDAIGQKMGVTHEQLNKLFQYANREITLEEFKDGN